MENKSTATTSINTHGSQSQYQGLVHTPDIPGTEKAKNSKPDHLKTCDSQKVNTSNTKGLSTTKTKSNTNFSTTSKNKAASCSEEGTVHSESTPQGGEGEREILVDQVITAWNQTGVNFHHRLGTNTKHRIQRALGEVLEDYTMAELLGTITTYAKLYKAGKSKHRYRLVEFLE